jgi:hypothetical protein
MRRVISRDFVLLQLEMATLLDVGSNFCTATYMLESDGFCGLDVARIIESLRITIRGQLEDPLEKCVFVKEVWNELMLADQQDYPLPVIIPPMISKVDEYFHSRFIADGCPFDFEMKVFNAISFLHPVVMKSKSPINDLVDRFTMIPVLKPIIPNLIRELPIYKQQADEVSGEVNDVLQWFFLRKNILPTFFEAVSIVSLFQPSSAAAERVFSMLRNLVDDTQQSSLADKTEVSAMIRYNNMHSAGVRQHKHKTFDPR